MLCKPTLGSVIPVVGLGSPLHCILTFLYQLRIPVLPIVNFMTSGGQTESCQMTIRVLTVDRTGVDQ